MICWLENQRRTEERQQSLEKDAWESGCCRARLNRGETMTKCVVCGKQLNESTLNKAIVGGCWETVDWCEACIKKDGLLCVEEASTQNPFLVTRPPYHITYPKCLPETLRQKILNYKPTNKRVKRSKRQLEQLGKETLSSLLGCPCKKQFEATKK
jgi:hypothetical protein